MRPYLQGSDNQHFVTTFLYFVVYLFDRNDVTAVFKFAYDGIKVARRPQTQLEQRENAHLAGHP